MNSGVDLVGDPDFGLGNKALLNIQRAAGDDSECKSCLLLTVAQSTPTTVMDGWSLFKSSESKTFLGITQS
jgi:hypothetical protein